MKVIDYLCNNSNPNLKIQDYIGNTIYDISCLRLTNDQLLIIQQYFAKIKSNQLRLCLAKYSLLETDREYFNYNPNSLPNLFYFAMYYDDKIIKAIQLYSSFNLIDLKKVYTDNDKKIPKYMICI
jgi:hypothetical protein